MPKWMTFAFALFLSLQVFSTQAHHVDDVIYNYTNAVGGKKKLYAIHALYKEGIGIIEGENSSIFKHYKFENNLCSTEIITRSGSLKSVVTNNTGSMSNFVTGEDAVNENALKMERQDLDCAGPLVDYSSKGYNAELLGTENINGIECYRIKLFSTGGQSIDYYIDSINWFIIREIRTRNDKTIRTLDYSDYRKTPDGYVFAYEVRDSQTGCSVSYKKIEVNKSVDTPLYNPGIEKDIK